MLPCFTSTEATKLPSAPGARGLVPLLPLDRLPSMCDILPQPVLLSASMAPAAPQKNLKQRVILYWLPSSLPTSASVCGGVGREAFHVAATRVHAVDLRVPILPG